MDNDASKIVASSGNHGVASAGAPAVAPAGGDVVVMRTATAISGLVPQTLDDVYRLASAIAKSGLAPKDMRTPEAITVAILTGLELGLKPMFALNKISVINGRPTLWGDAIPGLLWSRGFALREWHEGEGNKRTAFCEVRRPNGERIVRSFCVSDAQSAGLWGKAGPWKQFPDRMLSMRARAFAARDGAADILGGLYVTEEINGGTLEEVGMSAPFQRKSSAQAKRDGTVERFNELRSAISACTEPSALMMLRENNKDADGNPWRDMPMRWNEMLEEDFWMRATDIGLEVAE